MAEHDPRVRDAQRAGPSPARQAEHVRKVGMRPVESRRVLISGGTTGIGRATLILLAQEGARLLTFGRHAPELAEAIEAAGLVADSGLTADASRREDVERVFAAAEDRLGGIDDVVLCAALGAEPIDEMDDDGWRYAVETNLVGTLACARQAIKRMRRGKGGNLVIVGSISSEIKAPGESVYAATKAGLAAFVDTLRKEIADSNIRVTLIQPGSVGTDMQECSVEEQRAAIDRHEMLYAEEVAEAILFCLTRSERCDVVTLRIEPRLQKTS